MSNHHTSPSHPGFELARRVTRAHAKTFYFASFLLQEEQRAAAYAIYALCRFSDDAVDKSANPLTELRTIEQRIARAYGRQPVTQDDILTAFQKTVQKYQIPQQYFDDLLTGMKMDLSVTRYATFKELKKYCYHVAGVVGLIMLKIFGYHDLQAEQHAITLGTAMQLTNILRDISEDLNRGRIYLPQEELETFHVSEQDLKEGRITNNLKNFLMFQIRRARDLYRRSLQGIPLITDDRGKTVAFLMADLYGAILSKIEKNPRRLFTRRVHVPLIEKIWRMLRMPRKFNQLMRSNPPRS